MGVTTTDYSLPPWSLREYQVGAVNFAHPRKGTMLLMGMRTGKTRSTCAALDAWDSHRVIVVLPKAISDTVWREHVEEFMPRHTYIDLADGSPVKKRAAALLTESKYGTGRLVAGINYGAFWRPAMLAALNALPQFDLVFDEIHKLKTHDGKASEAAFKLAMRADHVLGLTGTVFPNSPLDGFGAYRPVDIGVFGRSFTRFKGAYANVVMVKLRTPRRGKYGKMITHFPEVVGFKNEKEMARRMNTCTWRVDRSVLKLTPATHEVRHCSMPSKAMTMYRMLERGIALDVESGTVNPANALVRALRLQQLTGGMIVSDDGDAERVHTAKRDEVVELLGSIPGEPFVIFYKFVADKNAIFEAARTAYPNDPVSQISGQGNDLRAWNAGEGGNVIAVQVGAGQEGIDLSRAAYCGFYSTGFSLGDYDQALARIHGGEQERPVGYFHFVVPGTIDEAVSRALRAKGNVNKAVLTHIRKRR